MDPVDHVDVVDPVVTLDPIDLMDNSKWLDPDLDKKMSKCSHLGPYVSTFWESLRNQISGVPQPELPT